MSVFEARISDAITKKDGPMATRHAELTGRLAEMLDAQRQTNALLERIAAALEAGR